mgnify:FL=1
MTDLAHKKFEHRITTRLSHEHFKYLRGLANTSEYLRNLVDRDMVASNEQQ